MSNNRIAAIVLPLIASFAFLLSGSNRDQDKYRVEFQGAVKSTIAADTSAIDISNSGESPQVVNRPGFDVDLFMASKNFAALTYPKREELTREIGEKWCLLVPWRSYVFAPKLRIRDLNSGELQGTYRCILQSATLDDPGEN